MKSKAHILVVDDEPNVLVTYRLILQQQGYEVTAALSSDEARKALAEENIDLLLCDLSLEKQENGFDVIEFGRQRNPAMPTLLLTGYATQEANDRAEELGIPMLFKPIDIKELLQTISEMLRDEYEQNGRRPAKTSPAAVKTAKVAKKKKVSKPQPHCEYGEVPASGSQLCATLDQGLCARTGCGARCAAGGPVRVRHHSVASQCLVRARWVLAESAKWYTRLPMEISPP